MNAGFTYPDCIWVHPAVALFDGRVHAARLSFNGFSSPRVGCYSIQ